MTQAMVDGSGNGPGSVFIHGEEMTLEQFTARQVRHTLRTGTASFDTMLGTLVCDECSRKVQAELHDNGHWKMWTIKILDKGDPFALHTYCSGGVCMDTPTIAIGD